MKPRNLRGLSLTHRVALSLASSLAVTLTANAATSTWNGANSGVWDTVTANWTGSTFTSGNDALFSGTPITNVTSATGLTIGAITLDGTFTGTAAMTGDNTVSGATTISSGILSVLHTGTAIGTVAAKDLDASALTVNGGGTFTVDDSGNGTTGNERILALANNISGAGTINAKASGLHTAGWSSINFTGNLSGFTGTLNVVTPSTTNRAKVKFTSASQSTLLPSSATVNVQNGAQLYLTQALNYGFALKLNGGTGGENNGSLRLDNAALNLTGAVTLNTDSTISGAGIISGAIGQNGGNYVLTKVGGNTTVLTGTNTYSGGTTISAGSVSVGGSSPLGTGVVTMAGGTTLSSAAAATVSNNVALTGDTTFNAASANLALGGAISGTAGSVTISGASTVTLSGTNTILPTSANFKSFIVTGNLVVTGSTTVSGAAFTDSRGYLDVHGNASITIPSGGSFALNTSTAAGLNSIIGQNAAGTSTITVSGGALSISGNTGFILGNNIATAIAVLTVNSGTATITSGSATLQNPLNFLSLGRDNATGIINLDGGTLQTGRQIVRDGSSGGTQGSGTATFNFNGGTLKALASQTAGNGWIENSTSGNFQAVTTNVKEGGALIDTNGFDVNINTALVHAGALPTDGGLTKSGAGILSLGGANTYTGTTQVTAGTLVVPGSLTGPVTVSSTGILEIGGVAPSFTMTTLSLPVVTLGGGGALSFDVETTTSNDQLTVSTPSGLTLNSGGKINLYDYNSTNPLTTTGTFTLINYSGTLNGAVANLSVGNARVGYAYSFGNTGSAITVTVSLTADTDGDGMPDVWEDAHGLNKLVKDASGNPDHDFATNIEEYLANTDPQNAHSDPHNLDDDGLEDSWEISYFGNITAQNGSGDPDADFSNNLAEQAAFTDPTSRSSAPDSDGDGISDAWEIATFGNLSTANTSSDYDHDGYSDYDEYIAGTNTKDAVQTPDDTDGDGLADAWEQTNFGNLTATAAGDPDGDYATNEQEETAGTNPNSRTSAPDGDGDGIGDAWEIHFFTNTTTATTASDFDADTLSDLQEFIKNSDPTNATSPYNGTAVINWGTPVTITADTDIITTGTLVHAGNFRSDNTNVSVTVGAQTILFANRQSQNAAGVLTTGEEARVIAGSGGRQVAAALFDATGTTVGATFESVLDGSAWENTDPGPAPGATDIILRVTGASGAALVTGQQYQIQLFYSDDRAGNSTRGQLYHDNVVGGHQSAPVLAGDSKYVIGTFTASGSGYQDVYIQNTSGGDNFPVGINGYVLRTAATNGYSTWANTNAPGQTANQDYDGDGVKNGVEYFMGATGSTFTANPSVIGGTVTWPKSAGFSGSYIIQTSSNLVNWATAVTGISDNGSSVVYTLAPSQSKLFVRLLVTPN